jgi:hypothetical protein
MPTLITSRIYYLSLFLSSPGTANRPWSHWRELEPIPSVSGLRYLSAGNNIDCPDSPPVAPALCQSSWVAATLTLLRQSVETCQRIISTVLLGWIFFLIDLGRNAVCLIAVGGSTQILGQAKPSLNLHRSSRSNWNKKVETTQRAGTTVSTGHFFRNSLTALNWPRFVKGALVRFLGKIPSHSICWVTSF